MASEEYASRMASPRPVSSGRPASISDKTGANLKSPLHQANFPGDPLTRTTTYESEPEDVIHIDPPSHRASKIGSGGYDPPKEDLGPEGGNSDEQGGWVHERGHGVPILASDEIVKHPDAEYRQPAISPELVRRGSGEYILNENDSASSYLTKQRSHSRNSSRNKMQASQRFASTPNQQDRGNTPLDSTKEYEPLFPEDDEKTKTTKTMADKLKRPDLARHHFPSQDVWEDTPSSLQLETTVDTPQSPEDREEEPETTEHAEADATRVFETARAEQARKDNITEEDQKSFLPENTKRFANKHLNKEHLDKPTRPGMGQRFPSQDIWEDAPDHGQLETTVSGPQTPDTNEYADESPIEKPQIPARPSIPARPQKQKELSPVDKTGLLLPEKQKPQIPARPTRSSMKSSERVPTLGTQGTGAEAASASKPKPPIPARPAGGKLAALQAGFMKDLNSKLGLGPQVPKIKEPEPEEEPEPAKPLTDARKGRAKGPQRRKPTASVSPAPVATVTSEVAVPKVKLELASVTTVWSIGHDGDVDVPAATMSSKLSAALKPSSKVEEPADEKIEASEKAPEESLFSKPEVEEPEKPKVEEIEKPEVKEPEKLEVEEPKVDLPGDISSEGDATESEEDDFAKTTSKEDDLEKTLSREDDLEKTFSREDDLEKTSSRDDDLAKTLSKEDDLAKTASKENEPEEDDFAKTTSKEDDLTKTTSKEDDLTKTTSKEDDLTKTFSKEDDLAKTFSKDDDLAKTFSKDDDLAKTFSKEDDLAKTFSKEDESEDDESEEDDLARTISKENEPPKPIEKELEQSVDKPLEKPAETKSSVPTSEPVSKIEPKDDIKLEKTDTMPGEFPEPTPVEEQIQAVFRSNEGEGNAKIHDV
jgi:hypothetical protein